MSELVEGVAKALDCLGLPGCPAEPAHCPTCLDHARTTIVAVQDIVAEQLMKKCGGACAGAFEGIIDEALK